MENQRFKLKEQPEVNTPSMEWLDKRYPKPQSPSPFQRIVSVSRSTIRRAAYVILPLMVLFAVFLAVPLSSSDDYLFWFDVRDALKQMQDYPQSEQYFQQVWSTVDAGGWMDDQPVGIRPEKWFQYFHRVRYDAAHAVVQTLALGCIFHGEVSQGIGMLDRLYQRTGDSGRLISACGKCKDGKVVSKCLECNGSGKCNRCNGQGVIGVKLMTKQQLSGSVAAHRNASTHESTSRSGSQRCPTCRGTGVCGSCDGKGSHSSVCAACGGRARMLTPECNPDLFQATVKATLAVVDQNVRLKRMLHDAANAQQAVLRKTKASLGHRVQEARQDGEISVGEKELTEPTDFFVTDDMPIPASHGESEEKTQAVKTTGPLFYMQWTQGKQMFGPYTFTNGAVVGTKQAPFVVQMDSADGFSLVSQSNGVSFGPFEFRDQSVITMGQSQFRLIVEK